MLDVLKQVGFAPRACVWELTLACNLRCKHCGSIAGSKREREMSLDESLQVADQLAALGCRRVTLSGGEPTLNPDWDRIGKRLGDHGIKVNLISNGWHWSAAHVARAKAAGLCGAAFSLDGFEREHDEFRQRGSFARVVSAIDACVAGGLPVAVNTTVNTLNARTLRELRDFVRERGAFSMQVQLATPSGNMGEHRDLVIDPKDLLWLVPELSALCRENTRQFFTVAADDIGYYGKPEQLLRDDGGELPFWIGCRAGCQVVGIESGGNVKGCLSLPSSMHGEGRFVEGNLRDRPLAEIWNAPGAFAYNRAEASSRLTGFCGVCRYREFCRGGCTWTVYCHAQAGGEGNPFCFYHQAVKHDRADLLTEPPTHDELAFFGRTVEADAPSLSDADADEPVSAQALLLRARDATDDRRFDEAHRLLARALAIDPGHLGVLDLLGFVCFSLRDYAAAAAYNRRALALDPNRAYAHSGLGLSLARQGNLDEGCAAIERAIALAPTWYEPYHDLAVVLCEAGQPEQACAVLARARQAVPGAAAELATVEAAIRRQASQRGDG
jgi:radical SAM protein with 4Fe4S-binding SPASM domain